MRRNVACWRVPAEGVDLEGEVAEGVAALGTAGAEGEVVFAQSSDDVRERLQRAHELLEEVCGDESLECGEGEG